MPAPRTRQRRYHKGKPHSADVTDSDSVIVQAFHQFRKELDEKHDKYERIIKFSRDITIESKRLIFSLHALCRSSDVHTELKKFPNSFQKLLNNQFKAISKELEGEDPYQFLRAYSSGLQEYIEAVTLYHYLEDGSLYNWNQFQKDLEFAFDFNEEKQMSSGEVNPEKLSDPANEVSTKYLKALIPLSDYVLGVQDLSGELMRFCINSFAARKIDNGFSTCNFIKMLYIGMLHLGNNHLKEFWRKQFVFKQSLLKMETACYMMHVRGSEILNETFTVAIEDEPSHEEYSTDFF